MEAETEAKKVKRVWNDRFNCWEAVTVCHGITAGKNCRGINCEDCNHFKPLF